MPKVKIDLGIKDYINDIDVNLLELNGKKEITEAIQTWESLHDQKIGPLHKIVADEVAKVFTHRCLTRASTVVWRHCLGALHIKCQRSAVRKLCPSFKLGQSLY